VQPPETHATDSKALDPVDLEQDLLRVVRDFTREVHPSREVPVTLNSSLERDLAVDSLGRMELLSRVERRLGLSFPERAAFEAETPGDLLLLARPHSGVLEAPLPSTPPAPSLLAELPTRAVTLPEVLRWHASRHPDRVCVQLLAEDGAHTMTYGELLSGAEGVAAGLRASGVLSGESVGVMLPTSLEYFHTLHGVLLAGAVPVPIYPPHRPSQIEEHVRRQVKILANAETRLLVTVEAADRLRSVLEGLVPTLGEVVTHAQLVSREGACVQVPAAGDDVALLQYTSGSTGDPKGVVLTHANLLASVRTMGAAIHATSTDVFVSWLPLYHDMGLIGACLATLYHGTLLVLMSPVRFLTRPVRWLRAIQQYGGTLSAGPNFAYEICATRIDERDLAGLDLSTWRVAFNGAEPVNPGTLQRFADRFEPCGFRAESMLPVYGLAESSLGLAFPPLGRLPKVDRVARDALVRWRRADAASEDDAALAFVCCGHALPGHELRVVDADGREFGERQVGRLQFRGPSTTSGYHRNPDATASLFDGDWLESGDNAYVADGEVYLTGRSKDLIIKGGRNFYPHELEAAVGSLAGVRTGCVAVFGSLDPRLGTERLVVVAETRCVDDAALEALRLRIVHTAADLLGLPPDDVVVAPPRPVPKTSSGKIRRSACRDLYERGELGVQRAVWWQMTRLALAGLPARLRRLLASAADKAYAVYAGAVLGLLAAIVWLSIPLTPWRSGRQALTRWAARLAAFLCGVRLTVQGLEHLEGVGPRVFASNHASYLDAFVLVAALPGSCTFTVKRELASNPWLSWHLRLLGHVFVERIDTRKRLSDVEQLVSLAAEGRSPLIFPEGTFVRAPGLRPFHMGAFVVSTRTGAPVIPVAIRGSRSLLRGGQWFPRRGDLTVTLSAPLCPEGEEWDEALRLRDRVRAQILRDCGEPDLASEPLLVVSAQPVEAS
jgi:1-acyl-sn-glycerol-3-phosphate acyltransferase